MNRKEADYGGRMSFLRQTLRKEHLLNNGIYSEKKGPLPHRIDYAWNVYNSQKIKYTPKHKQAALLFLTTTFNIPTHNLAEEELIKTLSEKMQLNTSDVDDESITSLNDTSSVEDLEAPTEKISDPTTSLNICADVLIHMSPEKISILLGILSKGKQFNEHDFRSLYKKKEKPAYETYQQFLNQHSIRFLGGVNSIHFKITSRKDHSAYSLKIENRLRTPKNAETHLREHSLYDVLSTVFVERLVACKVKKETIITSALLLTNFCQGKKPQAHSARCSNDNDRIKSALHIYHQMAIILYKIQQDGCAFPDMKNSNWRVDNNNILQIADTQSFAFMDEEGRLDCTIPANTGYTLQRTRYISPPELFTQMDYPPSVEKIHSYMLGKNLYQYLTKCSSRYLAKVNDASLFNFSAAIFQTAQGKRLKDLIKSMVNSTNPSKRITMDKALLQLKQIKIAPLQHECHMLLEKIKATYPEEQDLEMNDFFRKRQAVLARIDNEAELIELKRELNIILVQFDNDHTMRDIQNKLLDIKTNVKKTAGMQKKLNNIRAEIYQIPITARKKDSPVELGLLQTISSLYTDFQRYQECHNFLLEMQRVSSKKNAIYFDRKISELYNTETLDNVDTFKQQVQRDFIMLECHTCLTEINRYKFGALDKAVDEFIKQKNSALSTAKNLDEMHNILYSLRATLREARNNVTLMRIREIISEFRDNALFYTVGMNTKANRIEQMMALVPVEERPHIMRGRTPEAINVQKALASHRHYWKQGQEINRDGSINEDHAAASFKHIKARFFELNTRPQMEKEVIGDVAVSKK